MKQFLKKLNPNVELPYPKCIELKKLAIDIEEYAELRKFGQRAEDIPEPADPVVLVNRQEDFDIEATNWLLNEGYKSRAAGMLPKPKKKKHEVHTCNDFVDTTKAIDGTSGSEEEDFMKKARSKADRDLLASVDNTGKFDEAEDLKRGRRKRKAAEKTTKADKLEEQDQIIEKLKPKGNRDESDIIGEIEQY